MSKENEILEQVEQQLSRLATALEIANSNATLMTNANGSVAQVSGNAQQNGWNIATFLNSVFLPIILSNPKATIGANLANFWNIHSTAMSYMTPNLPSLMTSSALKAFAPLFGPFAAMFATGALISSVSDMYLAQEGNEHAKNASDTILEAYSKIDDPEEMNRQIDALYASTGLDKMHEANWKIYGVGTNVWEQDRLLNERRDNLEQYKAEKQGVKEAIKTFNPALMNEMVYGGLKSKPFDFSAPLDDYSRQAGYADMVASSVWSAQDVAAIVKNVEAIAKQQTEKTPQIVNHNPVVNLHVETVTETANMDAICDTIFERLDAYYQQFTATTM